jgi:hypothetical protein
VLGMLSEINQHPFGLLLETHLGFTTGPIRKGIAAFSMRDLSSPPSTLE